LLAEKDIQVTEMKCLFVAHRNVRLSVCLTVTIDIEQTSDLITLRTFKKPQF